MAPNRKNISCLAESLCNVDLQSLVQPKFAPLTESLKEEKVSVVVTPPSTSYWDWTSDQDVTEQVDVLSLSNIESNLIQSRAEAKSAVVTEHDDYWAEGNEHTEEEKSASSAPQHVQVATASYWDWQNDVDPKRAMIDRILAEDAARNAVASSLLPKTVPESDTAQVHATKAANDGYWGWESPVTAEHTSDLSHPSMKYWDWETKDIESPLVEFLRKYEAAREVLAVAHVEAQLKEAASTEIECEVSNSESSSDYWQWSESLGDNYWATTPQVAVSTGSSYWDW